jgi:hypothetical protein
MEIHNRIQANNALRASAGQSAGEQNTSTQANVKPAGPTQTGVTDLARQTLQSALSLLQPVRPSQTTLLAQLAAINAGAEPNTNALAQFDPWRAQPVRPGALSSQLLSTLLASANQFSKQAPILGSPGAILSIIEQLFRNQLTAPGSEQVQRLLAGHGLGSTELSASAQQPSNGLTNQLLLATQQQFGALLVKRLLVVAKRTAETQGGIAQTPVMDVDIPIAVGQHIGTAHLQISYREHNDGSADTPTPDHADSQKLWQFSLRLALPTGANFQANCTLEHRNVSLVLKTDQASLLPLLEKQTTQLTKRLSESGFAVIRHSCSEFNVNEQPPPCPTIDLTT